MGLFGKKKKDLTYEGLPGTAVITKIEDASFWDSDESTSLADFGIGSRKLKLSLDVTLDGGRPAYAMQAKFKVPAKCADAIGKGVTVPLYADPDDPNRVEINWDQFNIEESGGEGWDAPDRDKQRAVVHNAMPPENRATMVNGWVNAANTGGMSRAECEQALDEAAASGMLTAEEATAAKSQLTV